MRNQIATMNTKRKAMAWIGHKLHDLSVALIDAASDIPARKNLLFEETLVRLESELPAGHPSKCTIVVGNLEFEELRDCYGKSGIDESCFCYTYQFESGRVGEFVHNPERESMIKVL